MFKVSNLKKPSNKKAKKIADLILYFIPLYIPIIAALDPVSPSFSKWTIAILASTVVGIKGATKFTAEPEPEVVVEETPTDKPTEDAPAATK